MITVATQPGMLPGTGKGSNPPGSAHPSPWGNPALFLFPGGRAKEGRRPGGSRGLSNSWAADKRFAGTPQCAADQRFAGTPQCEKSAGGGAGARRHFCAASFAFPRVGEGWRCRLQKLESSRLSASTEWNEYIPKKNRHSESVSLHWGMGPIGQRGTSMALGANTVGP